VGADLCEAALEIRNGWRYTALRLAETTLKVTSQGRLEAEARGLTKGLNDKVKTLQAARDGLRDQLRLVRQKHTADVADLRAENVAGLAEKEKECSELVRLVRVELERVEDELQQAISKVETVEGERAANQIDFDEAIAAKDKECLELLGRTRRTNRRLCHTLDLSKTRVASLVRQRVGLQTEHDAAIAAKDEECLTIVARMWVARRRLQRQLDGAFEAQSASRVQLDSCRAESATRDAQHRIDMDELQATSDAAHDRLTALQASKDALQAELSTTLAAKESLLLTLDKLQQKTNRREAELEGLRTDLNDAGNSLLEALAKEQNNEALIIRLRNELAEERSNMETARAEQLAAERSTPEAQQAAERTVANVADKDSTIRQLRVRLADEQAATRRAERERARALEQRDEANRLRECADSALCQGTAYNRQRVEALQREVASEQRKRVALEDRLRQLQRPSEAREKRQQEEELPGEGDVAVFHAEQQVGLQARGIVDGSDLPKLRWELRTGQTALKNANLERQKDRAELQAQQAKLGSETARADDLAKATALAKSEKAEIKAGLETLRRQLKHLVEWMNFEDGQERSAAETRSALREKAASHEVRATAADQAMPLLRQVSELKVTITRLEHGLEKAGAKTEEVNHERPLERSQSAEADRQELERVKAQLEAMERDRTSIYAERAELADLRDEVLRLRRDLAELKTTLELEEQTAEALLDDAYQAGKELDELGVELNDAATARSAEEESSRAERAKVASRRRRELELLENPEFCNDVDGASAADRDAELEEIRGLQQRYEAEDEMAGWGIAQMRIVEEYRQAVEKLRSQAREAERARMRGPSVLDVLHTTRKVGESDVLRRLVEGILWERADCGGDAGSSWASSSLENSA
jgi:DNA repair exonuclease SbcCD ATPase subunit